MGERRIVWLTESINNIIRNKRKTDEFKKKTLQCLYNNKGDIQNGTNYCGIKLMSHTMKLWKEQFNIKM